jgi:ketosteroid isomerase-like protein
VSDEENFELIRRFNQVVGGGDLDELDELLAPDFVAHGFEGEVSGRDAWREFVVAGREQFGESEAGIEELIGNGDLVAERWWIRAAAGTRRGITMHRIVDGRLQEDWAVYQDTFAAGG